VASLSEELAAYDPKMWDAADSSWKRLLTMNPELTVNYVDFLLRQNDRQNAATVMELCGKLYREGKQTAALQRAIGLLRNLSTAAPNREQYVATVGQWLDSADPEKTDKSFLVLQRSEFEGLSGRADAQEKILRDFLAEHPVKDHARAIVLNNLAYMMALKGRGDEAQKFIDGALEILGPLATLHDTIGMVRLAQNDAKGAVAEFQMAIDQGETAPLVYVHLAMAQWKAGNQEGATDALLKAQQAGLDEQTLGPWEQPLYRQLVQELEAAGVSVDSLSTPVNKSEPVAADAT
jgi:tetratricopeptide (TPR) repeat protein